MSDRHSDPIDEAADLADSLTQSAVDAVRKANQPETHPDFDGECCVSCGNEIPADRLALKKVRCVSCQSRMEHMNKQYYRSGWADSL